MNQQLTIAFVLYKDKNIVPLEIGRFYQKLWREKLDMDTSKVDVTGTIKQFQYAISFVDAPIDTSEMSRVAHHNARFEEGQDIAMKHQCHAIVGIRGVGSAVARYQALTKLLAAMLSSYNALAVYLGRQSLYYGKKYLLSQAKQLDKGQLPISAWIYFGFYAYQEAYWVYTQGLNDFGRLEVEIYSDSHTMQEMHHILIDFCALLVANHHQYQDGELVEVGDWFVSVHYVDSPTLKAPAMRLKIENE